MTTALDIITDALLEIGAHDLGQSVPPDDAAMALRKLNQILERWSNSPLTFPVLPEISITMTGAASYTVGPSGGTVAARPIRIDQATFVSTSGIEDDVNVLSREEWDAISFKNVNGGPVSDIWYEASATNGRVYVYPKAPNGTLKIKGATLVSSFTSLTTTSTLPVGYDSALTLALAVDLCGPYRTPVTPDLQRRAAGSIRAIKRMNAEPVLLDVGPTGDDYQIERGY